MAETCWTCIPSPFRICGWSLILGTLTVSIIVVTRYVATGGMEHHNNNGKTTLYFHNKPNVTEEEVKELFSLIGVVDKVKINTDKDGVSKFGFVEFKYHTDKAESELRQEYNNLNVHV